MPWFILIKDRERERKAVYLTVAQSVQKCLVKCTLAPKEAYKPFFKLWLRC